jgi:fimbrial chaperone protein
VIKAKLSQAAVCGLAFFLAALDVHGGSLSISPIRLTLSSGQTTGSLSLRNTGTESSSVQMQIMRWSQTEGSDVLEETEELLATPPIFSIEPGGVQVIRVGLRRAIDPSNEIAFRLILREIPPPPNEDFTGMRMVLELSLPVFVLPLITAEPSLQWGIVRNEDNALTLTVRNGGNAHIKIKEIRLASVGGGDAGTIQVPKYVLIGGVQEWPVDMLPTGGPTIILVAQTDAGEIRTELTLPTP